MELRRGTGGFSLTHHEIAAARTTGIAVATRQVPVSDHNSVGQGSCRGGSAIGRTGQVAGQSEYIAGRIHRVHGQGQRVRAVRITRPVRVTWTVPKMVRSIFGNGGYRVKVVDGWR